MRLILDSTRMSSKSEPMLQQIDRRLRRDNQTLTDVTGIKLQFDPEQTFSATRNTITVANALAFSLGIKVNGKTFETPIYQYEPHITVGKYNKLKTK